MLCKMTLEEDKIFNQNIFKALKASATSSKCCWYVEKIMAPFHDKFLPFSVFDVFDHFIYCCHIAGDTLRPIPSLR